MKFYPSDYYTDDEKYDGIADEDLELRLESFDYPCKYTDSKWKFTEFDLYY